MKMLLEWCHIAAVVHIVFISSAQEWVVYPEEFSHVSNKYIYVGPQRDWFAAVKACHQAQANITLINTEVNELMSIVTVLLNKGINSLWIEGRRSASFHPITYHLPSSIYYGKNVMEPDNSVDGLITKWMENEPALNEEDQCVVLTLHKTVDGGAEIHSKLDKCGKAVHNFVCVTYPCLNQDMKCWGQNTKVLKKMAQEHGILLSPMLEIRKENNKYILDVYSPEKLWNFSENAERITNPICVIEAGNPLIDNVCLLHQDKVLSWTSENSTLENTAQYSISKVVFRIISENEGYIICRAFVAETMDEIVSTQQLFRSDIKNHIFSVSLCYRIKICSLIWCEPTYSLQNWASLAKSLSRELKRYKEFERIKVRAIRMSSRTENTVTLIFRISIVYSTSAGEIETDHIHLNNLYSRLQMISSNNSDDLVKVLYVRSSKYCHAKKTYGNKILHWPVATIGQIVLPNELCVTREGVTVQRRCIGDFVVGAFWSDENENNGTLYECEKPSPRTTFLHELSFQAERKENATKTLIKLQFALNSEDTRAFSNITNLTPAEIQYTANTLAHLQHNILHGSDLPIIANITDAILRSSVTKTDNSVVEKMTHGMSNASNVILDSVDHMLNKVKLNYKETSLIVTPRFVTLVMDIESSSRTNGELQGLAALKPSKHSDKYFKKEDILTVSWNDSVKTLLTLGVSTAVLVPPQLTLQQTDMCSSSHLEACTKKHRLVINLFWDDGLFTSNSARIRIPLHVVSVTLDGVKHPDLNPPLILLFDSPHTIHSHSRKCVFWDFEANSGLGNWSDTGCSPVVILNDSDTVETDICICTHLTHFGQLLFPILEEETNTALDIITVVGCSVSLLGLFGIAVTAIVFPKWRCGASRKIQLHLSASLATLMAMFLVNSHLFPSPNQSHFCLILGVVLHFSLVSTFCWMLVAAWFQYLRLTKPLASLCRTPHILLKTAVFAWGFPFIPCVTLLLVSPSSYNSPQCYPRGLAHYFSVIAPISIIVSLNIAMFVLIICSIYKLGNSGMHADYGLQHIKNHQSKQQVAYRRLSTLVFLFFLLGLSWIFGIWNFSYLFCCTTTIQGFAFFVFFVVLEKNTRAKWSNLFAKKKTGPVHLQYNRSSSVSVIKRTSCGYQRTSRNTISTLSSLS